MIVESNLELQTSNLKQKLISPRIYTPSYACKSVPASILLMESWVDLDYRENVVFRDKAPHADRILLRLLYLLVCHQENFLYKIECLVQLSKLPLHVRC